MTLIKELRTRLRTAIGPFIGVFLVAYFAFHLVHGDRGLMAWWQVRDGIAASRAVLSDLNEERAKLEHRVHLLRAGSLDPDLLDERVRHVLNHGREDEIMILPDPAEMPR
jgi:cell division protein FtsB